MKRIIVSACLLFTLAFGLLTLGQAQRRNAPRSGRRKHVAANRPPKISSFTSPASVIALCPFSPTGTCSPFGLTLNLTTKASDPDGDDLIYKYMVTGGQIIGEGADVSWNLAKLPPGSYKVMVTVDDQHRATVSASANVSLEICNACDPPCTYLRMPCPEDVEEGQQVTFSVNVSGGTPDITPTYNWSVSAGTIIKGQGTPTIEVDTTGLGGKQVTAMVNVGGIPPECQSTASCEVQIRKR